MLTSHFLCFRFHETLQRLAEKLESIHNASGGKKINVISHSMGGLLVKCFMCLHGDVRIHFSFPLISQFFDLSSALKLFYFIAASYFFSGDSNWTITEKETNLETNFSVVTDF